MKEKTERVRRFVRSVLSNHTRDGTALIAEGRKYCGQATAGKAENSYEGGVSGERARRSEEYAGRYEGCWKASSIDNGNTKDASHICRCSDSP